MYKNFEVPKRTSPWLLLFLSGFEMLEFPLIFIRYRESGVVVAELEMLITHVEFYLVINLHALLFTMLTSFLFAFIWIYNNVLSSCEKLNKWKGNIVLQFAWIMEFNYWRFTLVTLTSSTYGLILSCLWLARRSTRQDHKELVKLHFVIYWIS